MQSKPKSYSRLVYGRAAAHVGQVGLHVAAEDAGVVRDDEGALDEPRLDGLQVVEVVFLLRVEQHEVHRAPQEGQHAERVAHDHLDAALEPGVLGVRLAELGEVRVVLDAREPAAARHVARDQDRRVAEERADLDAARGRVLGEEPLDHAPLLACR